MPSRNNDEFGALDVPVMQLKNRSDTRYLVYSTPDEYIEVEANTAQDAIRLSNIEKPYKVIHIVMDLDGVLDQEELQKTESQIADTPTTTTPDVLESTPQP